MRAVRLALCSLTLTLALRQLAPWGVAVHDAVRLGAGLPPELRAVGLAGLIAWACAGWLALLAALELVSRAPGAVGRAGSRVRAACTPGLLARALCASVAATPVLGGMAAASAATVPVAACGQGRVDLDRPAAPACGVPAAPAAPGEPDTLRDYVVRPGDSLWSIAARELGPAAGASAVARRWPAWWAENRATIGPDPGLVRPGQALVVPPRSS